MKVSVIIAAYNSERYIGRTIRSLLDQSFPKQDFEITAVDDGSTDRTANVLGSFGERIRVIRFETNRGLPCACNEGIRSALSRFVVRVDADDYVHEDFLRVEYLYLSLNDHIGAVACDYYEVDDRERIIARKNAEKEPIACGIMFRKDNLVDIGLYDENFLVLEDADLRIRYLEKHNIYHIELPLYRYRMHKSNMTKNSEIVKHYQNMLAKKHGKLPEDLEQSQ